MKQTHNLARSRLPAFTLVELIVVITILAIMATIGFISLLGYQGLARDSVRISDISTIEKVFSLYSVGSETFPLPDNAVTLTSSGEIIGYQ
jgi:prepilin-type N-terminal cleavage/methylation domain-containing protein